MSNRQQLSAVTSGTIPMRHQQKISGSQGCVADQHESHAKTIDNGADKIVRSSTVAI